MGAVLTAGSIGCSVASGPAGPTPVAGLVSAESHERAAPPPEPVGPVSLWLSEARVPPGDLDLVAVLVSTSDQPALFGVAASLERWDGAAWVPHRQVSLCLDGWGCRGSLHPLGEPIATPAIGLSASPGHPGLAGRFATAGLDPGWYRLSQGAGEGLVARGVFEVSDGAPATEPLGPPAGPSLSIEPALVPASGGRVTLEPIIPMGPTGQSTADVVAATAGLSETAGVERLDGGMWHEVGRVDLGSAAPIGIPTFRAASLPALDPGAYRLVRTAPPGDFAGRFWVVGFPL